ncbi:Bug family tripartite tricarboxylate transporter substrate binding protein [Arvimicrobium flavum]|uniref:Bug family tripartite tricarboxylate transporter substrate binding protein n=1 Tax=Arvimicrobium flavum TaxID=3393320 RepID=UPI00237BFE99|nr:tripartite tricarboxylate transporter substrate binding protein [Mesorhizobium shangrilense]
MKPIRSLGIAVALLGALGWAAPSQAQEYPAKPINWVIPFSPGSGADTFARTLITATEQVLGQKIVPVNKDGGGTAIGVAYSLAQAADGYTVFSQSDTVVLGITGGQWPVKGEDVQPIARINADYKTLVVPKNSPLKSYKDFVAAAKANPGSLKVGGVGSKSWSSFFVDKVSKGADIKVTYVPYDGGSGVVSAVLGENIDAAVVTSSNVNAQVDAGDLRMLALSLGERAADRPDVPTFVEEGHKDIDGEVLWRGVFAKAGTPEPVLEKLSAALQQATKDPRWQEYMKQQRQQDAYMDHKAFAEYFKAQLDEYSTE